MRTMLILLFLAAGIIALGQIFGALSFYQDGKSRVLRKSLQIAAYSAYILGAAVSLLLLYATVKALICSFF